MSSQNTQSSDISSTVNFDEIWRSRKRGLSVLKKPEPLRLSEWAQEHFYLSAESSYVEGRWEAFPYQIAIMDCISNDDIREIVFIKSARVGYTKLILAAIGYFAEHKKRNQAIWQPVDDDADEFVKTELDPMIRDVPAVQGIFPSFTKKSKNNTLRQKVFIGSTLHIRGGKAAKNYRRISIDVSYLDELDGFDNDVEREGDPVTLSAKRVEGATFPKQIIGSTPKVKSESMIEFRAGNAEMILRYWVPCLHCDEYQPLEFGGKEIDHGLKWDKDKPDTVAYLCRECSSLFSQKDYLSVWNRGVWRTDSGEYIDENAFFRSPNGDQLDPPLSIAFHIWTAYSSMTSWAQIIREFLAAKGDPNKLKTFINTTLGETWEEEAEKLDHDYLLHRREFYPATVPDGVCALVAGVDVQNDRIECEVIGYGRNYESWGIEYRILRGDPAQDDVWNDLDSLLRATFENSFGMKFRITAAGIDTGGTHTQKAYRFCKSRYNRNIYALKGASVSGKPIAPKLPTKNNAAKVPLFVIGTDTAKHHIYGNLKIHEVGPGFCHFPREYTEGYFQQLTSEVIRTGKFFLPSGRRNEVLDCRVYALAALEIRGLNLDRLADELENMVTEIKTESMKNPKRRDRRVYSSGVSA